MIKQLSLNPLIRLRNRMQRSPAQRALVTVLVLGIITLVAFGGSVAIGATTFGVWAFLGIIGLLAALLIVTQPAIGLYILVVFIFLNLSDVLEVAFGIAKLNQILVALIFVAVFARRVVLEHKPLIFREVEIAILGFGIAILVSAFGAASQWDTTQSLIDWLKDFAILIIVVQLSDDEKVWKKAQWALILSATLLAALSVYQMVTGDLSNDFYGLANAPVHQITDGFDSTRVTGPLEDPNYYAQILVMVLPMAVYRLTTERLPLGRFVAAVGTMLITLAVIFTYSRGAFLAMIIIGILVIRERKMNPYKIGGIILLILAFVIPLLPPGYVERLITLEDLLPGGGGVQTERSFQGRSSELVVASQMFLDHPITGVGHANFSFFYLDYSPRLGIDDRFQDREAHSLYLEVAAELGLVGLIAFGLMLFMLWRSLQRAKQQLAAIRREDLLPWIVAIQYGLTAYLVTSFFLHDDYSRYLWLMIGMVAGCSVLTASLAQQYEERRKERSEPQSVFLVHESLQVDG